MPRYATQFLITSYLRPNLLDRCSYCGGLFGILRLFFFFIAVGGTAPDFIVTRMPAKVFFLLSLSPLT